MADEAAAALRQALLAVNAERRKISRRQKSILAKMRHLAAYRGGRIY